jgi:UDP-N-acetylmuramate dehydrogenase
VLGAERVKENEPFSYHTYSKRGGPAEVFFIATNRKELIQILDLARELKINYFIFGGGTKIMIADKGMKGLVVKNRTSGLKVGGIKGKVGREGIGIEEALIDADSGISMGKLNDFLKEQNLKEVMGISPQASTLGGAIFLDPVLQSLITKINVWDEGEVRDIEVLDLDRKKHIILGLILKIKAKEE